MSFDLPEGWKLLTLTELSGIGGLVADGDWIESKDQDQTGDVRLIQLADIGAGEFLNKSARFLTSAKARELNCTMLEVGDLLIARMPDPLGRACLFPGVGQQSVTAVDVFIWRAGKKAAAPRWLMHTINSPQVREHLQSIAGGTTRQRVSGGNLKRLALPTPPQRTQLAIASQLDQLLSRSQTAYDELTHIPKLVIRYKQAVFGAAFSGNLTSEWRDSTSRRMEDWKFSTIGEIAHVGTGATPKRGNPRFYKDGTVPWVTSGAVNQETVDHAEEMITELALRETNCRLYPPGTLLMAMYGEGQTRGKVSILNIHAATNQALAALSVRDTHVTSTKFLFWFLRSNYLELRRKAAGGVQPNLNLGMIKAVPIKLPSIEEQAEIVRRIEQLLERVDFFNREASMALRLLERVDGAVLSKAFRGDLLVPILTGAKQNMVAAE